MMEAHEGETLEKVSIERHSSTRSQDFAAFLKDAEEYESNRPNVRVPLGHRGLDVRGYPLPARKSSTRSPSIQSLDGEEEHFCAYSAGPRTSCNDTELEERDAITSQDGNPCLRTSKNLMADNLATSHRTGTNSNCPSVYVPRGCSGMNSRTPAPQPSQEEREREKGHPPTSKRAGSESTLNLHKGQRKRIQRGAYDKAKRFLSQFFLGRDGKK
jgi:hypothetical protein